MCFFELRAIAVRCQARGVVLRAPCGLCVSLFEEAGSVGLLRGIAVCKFAVLGRLLDVPLTTPEKR